MSDGCKTCEHLISKEVVDSSHHHAGSLTDASSWSITISGDRRYGDAAEHIARWYLAGDIVTKSSSVVGCVHYKHLDRSVRHGRVGDSHETKHIDLVVNFLLVIEYTDDQETKTRSN
jgi:hypothetical protein